jgi:hypothetical protein
MYRIAKWCIIFLLAYASVTGTPAQQAAMLNGLVALREAVIEACRREKSVCTDAVLFAKGWMSPLGDATEHHEFLPRQD